MERDSRTLVLFDVDGTLTVPRNKATPEMLAFLKDLRSRVCVGIVGGSDFVKIHEQIGVDGFEKDFDFVFSENGLVAYAAGELLESNSLKKTIPDGRLKEFIKFTLRYISDLDIPVMRGTFIEFRSGMMNVSPIGRNCSQEERDAFNAFDNEHKIREKMVAALEERFKDFEPPLKFSIGGQISFDVFPRGWDKTYCLRYVEDKFDKIYFFGDKTYEGGNDYEIFSDKRTIGYSVTSPEDTMSQVRKLLEYS